MLSVKVVFISGQREAKDKPPTGPNKHSIEEVSSFLPVVVAPPLAGPTEHVGPVMTVRVCHSSV